MLSLEEPRRGEGAAGLAAFCDALAALLALRFGAETPGRPVPPPSPPAGGRPTAQPTVAPQPHHALERRKARLEHTLMQTHASLDVLDRNARTEAVVGVVKLPDWTTMAQRPTEGDAPTAMDAIVQEVRALIDGSAVSYSALLDDQIVLAAFSQGKSVTAMDAHCVATVLIALRDRLAELEEKWGTTLDFRLGIDVGTVMNSPIESESACRNLWGGAIGVAKILAATTARHTIAVSETAYELLSANFLLRPRGTYFLPETGNMRTFIIVDHL
jgi:class 3 adenylate cyclase